MRDGVRLTAEIEPGALRVYLPRAFGVPAAAPHDEEHTDHADRADHVPTASPASPGAPR
ncbi:hypothetical protein [Streptomyces sp. ICC1]|uniref:hypothetical protein n=1 Tax=Streptomyces sp. ICC1 TaxID=2099583 RepID=UPI001955161A|nr:hypothetical protein [Streptomyces sp. ICC1]